jgi:dTDP-4-amino-4,6-dideoxygalactose transaminase
MDPILELARKYHLLVIEDAAQAIDSYYKSRPLGSLGNFGAFSFHETKNIISGEGGMIVVNDSRFRERAEIVWEKGTNRAAFSRGEVDCYEWLDIGSSFLPSDLTAAYLFAQLEALEPIQKKRVALWEHYFERLKHLEEKGVLERPTIPPYATPNGNLFYVLCSNRQERDALIGHLRENGIHAVFHYLPLHESPFYRGKHGDRILPQARRYADCLVRMPLYYALTHEDVDYVCDHIEAFWGAKDSLNR